MSYGEETTVAMLDALFKIVIRENGDWFDILAFIYPQVGPGYSEAPYDHTRYLTTVDEVESVSWGLDFLTVLPDGVEKELESVQGVAVRMMGEDRFLEVCRN